MNLFLWTERRLATAVVTFYATGQHHYQTSEVEKDWKPRLVLLIGKLHAVLDEKQLVIVLLDTLLVADL